MFLSRVTINLNHLTPSMMDKWHTAQPYAAHQWLWQLFRDRSQRTFLFRQEIQNQFYLLSQEPPEHQHNLFEVETKTYQPQLQSGMRFDFRLRANPVVTRNNKRNDVLMDAKFHAKLQGVPREQWWRLQAEAATNWLARNGEMHGFKLENCISDELERWFGVAPDDNYQLPNEASFCVVSYQQHRCSRRDGEQPIMFSSVDYAGKLTVTDPVLFLSALNNGIGKSKALGCGLLLIRRG